MYQFWQGYFQLFSRSAILCNYLLLFIGQHQGTSVQVYMRKLFHFRFLCSQLTAPCTEKPRTQCTDLHPASNLGQEKPRRFVSCSLPEKFTLGHCMVRTRGPLICNRTLYHWTNVHRKTTKKYILSIGIPKTVSYPLLYSPPDLN